MTGSARMDDEQYLANVVSEVSLLENHENLNPEKSEPKYMRLKIELLFYQDRLRQSR